MTLRSVRIGEVSTVGDGGFESGVGGRGGVDTRVGALEAVFIGKTGKGLSNRLVPIDVF